MDALDNRIAFAPSALADVGLQGLGADPQVLEYLNHAVQRLVADALAKARRGTSVAQAGPIEHRPAAAPGAGAGRGALSQREREVLHCIAAGDSNKMIARTLNLSPHTVKRHVANILDKLDARSRAQAAAWLRSQH